MTFIARHKIPLLLFLLGVVLFSSTLDAQLLFSWDDNRYLDENQLVREFQIGRIFTQPYFGSYIPVTLFSYALEHKLWGLHPTGYHAVNMLLHALNGVLVFFFLFLLSRQRAAALIGAVLFLIHPVQVETVAWVAQRKNLLCMFFFLWAFICHIRSRQDGTRGWLWAAWFFYLLSILSKPAVVGAPLLFIAYDYFWARLPLRRIVVNAIVPIAIAVFGAAAILITSSEVGGIKELWGGSRWSAMQLTFLTTWENLVGLFNPSAHSPHYLYLPEAIQNNWRVWAGFLVLLSFSALSFYSLWRYYRDNAHKPITFFLYIWMVAFMLPVSNIVPIAIQRADRHVYFPSVMLFLMVGMLWVWLYQRYQQEHQRHVLVGGMVAVSVFFMMNTYQLSKIWTNSGTLWTYHLKNYPRDDIAVTNLAMYYFRTDQYPEARQVYDNLVRMTPDNFRPYLFLGLMDFREKHYDSSIRFFRKAMPLADKQLQKDIFSQLIDAYFKAITQAEREGRMDDVVNYYFEVIEYIPDNYAVYLDFGDVYRKMGQLDAAEQAYQRALSLSSDASMAVNLKLGYLRIEQKKLDAAQALFEQVLSQSPSSLAASGLCSVWVEKGNPQKGLGACYVATAMDQQSDQYALQLAQTLLLFQTPEQAEADVLERLKDYPDLVHLVSGHVRALAGQPQLALSHFQQSKLLQSQINLGKTALVVKDYALADSAFKQALTLNKDHLDGIGGRCLALYHSNDFKNALPLCKSAVELLPNQADYLVAYGDVLMADGRVDEAAACYHQAMQHGAPGIKAKLAAAYFGLGHTAEGGQLTGDAIKFYQQAVSFDANHKMYPTALGRLLLRQRRFNQARQAFESALAIDPDFTEARSGYCMVLDQMGEPAAPYCPQVLHNASAPQ